jgi:hypothetical protein
VIDMWTVVRLPAGGPIDEDSARPFVPLGAAAPLLDGVQLRKGSVLPWREAESTRSNVDAASRRFGSMLVRYNLADTNELYVVDDQERTAYFPGSVTRVVGHWKAIRGASVGQDYPNVWGVGWVDVCETENWVVTANWRVDGVRFTARHKSSGHVFEKTFPTASSSGLPVWPYPRVLRDRTRPDSFIVSYVQSETYVSAPNLSVSKHVMDRYTITVPGGLTQTSTYSAPVYSRSRSVPDTGPLHTFHDAREAESGVVVIAYSDDNVSGYRLRLVGTGTDLNRHEWIVNLGDYYPTALGYAHVFGNDTVVVTCCNPPNTNAIRWQYLGASWVLMPSLPVPQNIPSSVSDTAIGGDELGGWRVIIGMHVMGFTEEFTPSLTHHALWGVSSGQIGVPDSWDQHAVPFYDRGTWFYLIRQGNHAVIAAEYGAGGIYVEGQHGVVNKFRLIPVARLGTWIVHDSSMECAYPRRAVGSSARRVVALRTQVSSDCDVDVYVLDAESTPQHWEHDTIGVGVCKEACAGLLMSPDTVTSETGFVFGPVVVSEDYYTYPQAQIALQWERVGRDGEIHRSFPTAYTASHKFRVGTLLTRSVSDVRLLVWSADAAGVYRLVKTVLVSPYDQYSDWIMPVAGTTGQIAPWYGQLAHGPAPSPWHACVHGNRVWLISAEDRYSVWPSLLLNDVLAAPVFPAALAIVAHDDKLHRLYSTDVGVVVLGSKHIYIVRGDGPDNAGNGAPFEMYTVPGAVGCSGQACQTPWGVMYSAVDGIALLDRGVAVHMVSDQVREKIKGKTVRSMVYWPALQRAVVLYDGFMLLWHPERGWSYISINDAVAVRIADTGSLEVLFNNGAASQFNPLNEQCSFTGVQLSTAWLDAAVQPWIRIRKVRVRARKVNSPATATQIVINIYANGNDLYPAESRIFSIDYMQGVGNALYLTTRLSHQKYETIRVELRTAGAVPLEWEWIELEFLARRGVAKIGSGSEV